jgi:ribosomal protein L37AE/L43A
MGAVTIAALLDRSVASIEHKARELKISLVHTGEDIDLSQSSAKILERLAQAPELQVCPLCGRRLATMKATGMCRVCHLDQLILLRETQIAELVRERKLTKLRQDKKRMRVCTNCGRPYFPRETSGTKTCGECDGTE